LVYPYSPLRRPLPLTVDYRIPITNTTIFNGPITNNTLFNGTRDTSVIQALAISPVPISSYFHTVSLMNLTEKHETAKITKFTGYSISVQYFLFSVPFIAYVLYPLRYQGETYFRKK
jgi:hypothetical protein